MNSGSIVQSFSRIGVLVALFCFVAGVPAAHSQYGTYGTPYKVFSGNLNFFVGLKVLDDFDWEPAEDQDEIGISFDFKHRDWPFSLVIEYLTAEGDGNLFGDRFESETRELNFGIKKIWEFSPQARPFIGGGLSRIEGEFSGLGLSDRDEGTGLWLAAGIYWALSEVVNLGFEVKSSYAKVDLFGIEVDAGGAHIGAIVGIHF